ncbi:glycosyltransferase family 1 protein [Tolypothrix bouteillei VB521301]|uniref:Glycosyltransferase family 1 protein n=1 Tax=Tolypothrix bouteillei VB521301 TaxID=1479485 RepID=A0A8S9TFN1_9CYAN|nr:glycosyltransferase family 1 protein [Tolypothrix bouteillei VB521301]
MEKMTKPKLVFFQWKHKETAKFVQMHIKQHVKCLSEFFEVIVINEDCDYQEICDKYQPDLTLFESGIKYIDSCRISIKNTSAYPEIPKLGFHNGDSWCDCRAGFLSDMEHWGIETFFSICTTTAEHTPEIAENLFVWPNFVDADIFKDYSESKNIPILFSGHIHHLYPWRQQIYKIVSQNYPSLICPHLGYTERLTTRMMYGERYARTINASWFVPTCGTVAKEVVRKHFEIPASKSCLITEKTSALEACGFIDMQNCVFANEHDVLDKLDYLFQNLDELEKITNAGYQLVHSQHTLKQRDQIFQWFNLYKNLKPNQKIVQTNPFKPLIVVENSSEIKNSPIHCNGLDVMLLKQGDEKLWTGQYEEAQTLYLRCLGYIFWIPEPRLRLALCNLYQGKPAKAYEWILPLIKQTLEHYKALDPDPVEWAYLIISLLCQGKLEEAIKCANEFPSLKHPELDRTRWIINVLESTRENENLAYSDPLKYRFSVHQLPHRSFDEWVQQVSIMLHNSQQVDWAKTLDSVLESKIRFFKEPKNGYSYLPSSLTNSQTSIPTTGSKNFLKNLETQPIIEPKYITLSKQLILHFKSIAGDILRFLEKRFGYFLPYRFSEMRNDEFFSTIQRIAGKEDIKTAIIIGASAGEGTTEAFLTGIRENPNHPSTFCINISKPSFVKLEKQYSVISSINFHEISLFSSEDFPGKLNNCINEIKQKYAIDSFDLVLIDASELNFSNELEEVYGAKLFVLDDTSTFQNYKNHHRLLIDPNYTLVAQNPSLRSGYAIFKQVEY